MVFEEWLYGELLGTDINFVTMQRNYYGVHLPTGEILVNNRYRGNKELFYETILHEMVHHWDYNDRMTEKEVEECAFLLIEDDRYYDTIDYYVKEHHS